MSTVNLAPIDQTLKASIKEWAEEGFLGVMNEVNANLHGRVLNRKSGKLQGSVQQVSKPRPDGFQVGFEVSNSFFYGLVWEVTGRRAYTVRPRNKKALHWTQNGQSIFAKFSHIPAADKRPFIEPVIEDHKDKLLQSLSGKVNAALHQSFKNIQVTVTLR
jgi:hypothetical protein